MREPARKSGLAKAATGFAVGLGISLGLCGASALTIAATKGAFAESVMIPLAFLELAGFVLSAAGLLICGIIAILKLLFPKLDYPGDPK